MNREERPRRQAWISSGIASAVVFLILCGAPAADGQVPSIAPGTRVRLELERPNRKVDGTLMSQTADSIAVATDGSGIWTMPAESVVRIRVGSGKSVMRGAIRGMKIGSLVLGGGFGLLLTAAVAAGDGGTDAIPFLVVYSAIAAAEGAILGAFVGAIVRSEKWTDIYSSHVQLTVRPDRSGRTGVGLSIGF
jgi:hypothetical protein